MYIFIENNNVICEYMSKANASELEDEYDLSGDTTECISNYLEV